MRLVRQLERIMGNHQKSHKKSEALHDDAEDSGSIDNQKCTCTCPDDLDVEDALDSRRIVLDRDQTDGHPAELYHLQTPTMTIEPVGDDRKPTARPSRGDGNGKQRIRVSPVARDHVSREQPETPNFAGAVARDAAGFCIPAVLLALSLRWIMKRMDPNHAAEQRGKLRSQQLSKRLGRKITLQGLELVLAQEIVFPEQIQVTLADIGGLDSVAAEIKAKVLLPLQCPAMFSSSLLRLERGVLLYGRPGTGKTMLAQAVAAEGKATFLRISASSLLSKWFGETAKLATAMFSLARKIAPCVIFIDEADALLGRRREGEHEMMTGLKTEILQLWDGLLSGRGPAVMVLGATNRPYDLDIAVLRRFSLQLEVAMPGERQREQIIAIHLRKHMAETGRAAVEAVIARNVDLLCNGSGVNGNNSGTLSVRPLLEIARGTKGFSGSDLHHLCSTAASMPFMESATATSAGGNGSSEVFGMGSPRPMSVEDLRKALGVLERSRGSLAVMEHQAVQEERDRYTRHQSDTTLSRESLAAILAATTLAATGPAADEGAHHVSPAGAN